VRVEVIAARLETTGQVHLPDAIEWQLGEVVGHRLAAVALICPDVVEVQQDTAISLLGDCRHVRAVVEVAWDRAEVVGRGLHQEGRP